MTILGRNRGNKNEKDYLDGITKKNELLRSAGWGNNRYSDYMNPGSSGYTTRGIGNATSLSQDAHGVYGKK